MTTISGVGRWPRAATLDRIAAAGGGRIPGGPARWVVPAAVDAWLLALARYGTWSASDVLAGAIDLAEVGFPLNYFLRANFEIMQCRTEVTAEACSIFMPGGEVPPVGSLVRQVALAGTMRHLADAERRRGGSRAQGVTAARDAFYRGDIAATIGTFAREVGGFISEADINDHVGQEAAAVSTTYRGNTVYACGPWSQGPALLQMVNLLEGFDLHALAPAERAHVEIESAKIALLDRNRHYGDPDHVDVPLDRLLSKDYAARRRQEIHTDRALDAGAALAGSLSPDTTYVCVSDARGNHFSATPSDSTMLMSPMVPGLGFGVSDRGLQASLNPADPNAVGPGKRPRITPNPGLVVGDGFTMPYGSPGGEIQTQAMLQFLVNHLDLGMDVQAAAEAPRWSTTAVPATEDPHPTEANRVYLESRMDPEITDGLRRKGHDVCVWPPFAALAGGICAIRRNVDGSLSGGADPRRMGYGIGY